jgi:hypothetical protein
MSSWKKIIGKKASTSWRSPRDLACTALALFLGLVAGFLDLQVTEVIVTILALLIFGLLLGLLQPSAAWRWAILIVIGLPIMELVAMIIGLQTAEPTRFDLRISLVALVFALFGAYIGVFIRHMVRT